MILIGLSQGEKYPRAKTTQLEPAEIAAISKLRRSLKSNLNIKGDPFTEFNPTDGWKPRFKLIDDRNNADERAKREARHIQYDDSQHSNFEDEDDEAGAFIRNHDN